ncbi:DUF5959 family protein [Streptomyces fragilis]|uniref:DUF5959 family protein n=1 Tax=Streptomyces fragilis TaxID=67301 RepID=A0ABV2YF76_9ACTN|nr:DUF5959 family protein [Streptomyces fragilis]
MVDGQVTELIRFADDENCVTVRVLGSTTVGVPEGCLEVEIVAASAFAHGRLSEVFLLDDDLEEWAEALDRLASGQGVVWMDDGRNPEVRIAMSGPYFSRGETLDAIEVTVRDVAASLTSVSVLVRLADGWVEEHRRRLALVRERWPLGGC